jgi:hypothetical protein
MWSDETGSAYGRQEKHVAFSYSMIGAIVLQLAVTGDAYQDTWRSRCADCKRRFSAESPHHPGNLNLAPMDRKVYKTGVLPLAVGTLSVGKPLYEVYCFIS